MEVLSAPGPQVCLRVPLSREHLVSGEHPLLGAPPLGGAPFPGSTPSDGSPHVAPPAPCVLQEGGSPSSS